MILARQRWEMTIPLPGHLFSFPVGRNSDFTRIPGTFFPGDRASRLFRPTCSRCKIDPSTGSCPRHCRQGEPDGSTNVLDRRSCHHRIARYRHAGVRSFLLPGSGNSGRHAKSLCRSRTSRADRDRDGRQLHDQRIGYRRRALSRASHQSGAGRSLRGLFAATGRCNRRRLLCAPDRSEYHGAPGLVLHHLLARRYLSDPGRRIVGGARSPRRLVCGAFG